MTSEERIARINRLARKSRESGLSDEEKAEQQKLREEYIAAYRQSLRGILDNSVIVRPDGTREKVKPKVKK